MAPTLCQRCQRFNIQEFGRVRPGYCGYPVESILSSAHSGCLFCSLVLNQLRIALPKKTYSGIVEKSVRNYLFPQWIQFLAHRGELLGEEDTSSASLNIKSLQILRPDEYLAFQSDRTPITLHLAAEEGTPAKISNDITGKIITTSLSISDMPIIKAWYEDCYSNHSACRVTLSKTQQIDPKKTALPARLVKVELLPDQNSVSLTLCETEGTTGSYIALSHRWDNHTFTSRTTKANYICQQRLCNHSSSPHCIRTTFPPLYHDAGLIAHHLGINYIWIDSVCIVQDDANDWKKESVRMADYYQNAWLTIASTTTDETGGLLNMKPDPDEISTIVQLPYRDKTGNQKGHFYVQPYTISDVQKDYMKRVGDYCELRHRGWIFQEFILSRRLLTFSNQGVYMICQTKPPENIRSEPVGRIEPGFVKLPDTVDQILTTWEYLMLKYCALNFTKLEQDRILALSGVAKEFERALQTAAKGSVVDFAYGNFFVWESQLNDASLRGLLWQENPWDEINLRQKLRVLDVPTWSWASMIQRTGNNGDLVGMTVMWNSHFEKKVDKGDKNICQLKGISAVPSDVTLTPRISDPDLVFTPTPEYQNHTPLRVLELHGRLYPFRVHGLFADDDERDAVAKLTHRRRNPPPARRAWRRVTLDTNSTEVIGWASIESPEFQNQKNERDSALVYALFVRRLPRMEGGYGWGYWTDWHTVFEVLFLKKVEKGLNYYERVGMGRVFGPEVEKCVE
ncbi:heterokaryon incompatibility protein-domain-containing protein, partial [Podospora fimiseda]